MILSVTFDTPYNSIPFSKINSSDFIPWLQDAIETARKEIDSLRGNLDIADFQNTIEALEFSGKAVGVVSSVFFNLHSAETNEELQAIAQEFSPLLTAFKNDVMLDEKLFERIKYVWEKTDKSKLNAEQKMLLEKTYLSFVRNGALLNDQEKNRLRAIDEELSKTGLKFGENVLHETNAFELVIDDEKELKGLLDDHLEAAAELAKAKGKEGKWLFSLQSPSFVPFMKFSENRELREKLYRAYATRCCTGNAYDNTAIVSRLVELRLERANLLGYSTHADFVLERRMAEKPDTVWRFLDNLYVKAIPKARADVKKVSELASVDGIQNIEPWDFSFYAEQLKKRSLDMDEEKLKPYFDLNSVIEGAFKTAKLLYGLTFTPSTEVDVYHPDVKAYAVTDKKGDFKALFYADFFPREGKRPGAWMTGYREQQKENGVNHRPHVSIVCNFTKPTANTPSLLTFREVTTLFHEFGHALHGMLSEVTYPSLSGTSVYWDFVELPSQIMENWCYEKECLSLFAKHYKTDEIIPGEEIAKIKKSLTFMEGYQTMRQLSFGMLDMSWHNLKEIPEVDVFTFENNAMEKTRLLPEVAGTNMSCAFSHIFQGGYSAGYYSYKWAEVLDADAFELFEQKGIFNPDISGNFERDILSKGGSEHPMTLYKRFRGREPKVDALLKRSGLA